SPGWPTVQGTGPARRRRPPPGCEGRRPRQNTKVGYNTAFQTVPLRCGWLGPPGQTLAEARAEGLTMRDSFDQLSEFFHHWFDPPGFVARKDCGDWSDGHVLLHNVSDALIWLSYMAIPVVLVYFVRRKRDVPFHRIFWMFGLFIVSCGFTHLMEIVMFYQPL